MRLLLSDVRHWLTHEPMTKTHLAVLTGLSPREVEQQINQLRHAGVAIASDGRGYRIPRSSAEYRANIEGRRLRALHQWLTCRAEREGARQMALREQGASETTLEGAA